MTLRLSRDAQRDFNDIAGYIEQESQSIDIVDEVLDEIYEALRLLPKYPRMGRKRPDLPGSLRSVVVSYYVVFYTVLDQQVYVARILHGSRDLAPIFDD
ncbi:MAG TPA: type II toxin-antitoxin system RelE/ParE family toxin [Bryobacteraceae bacterium]|nr:type II toxin-antitoxin system RelE/ParE family toxin [Bryobacteraceae bacterium]